MTELPFFNWGAGMASTIVETIVRQWGKLAGSVTLRPNHDVLLIRSKNEGKIWLRAEGPSGPDSGAGIYEDTFDVLILAVGFGLERELETLPFLSYWENDNLGRPVMRGPLPRHYVVSGCGDGGLIDAIRLRIRDFDHGRFVYDLLKLPGIQEIKQRLRSIDEQAADLAVPAGSGAAAAASRLADRQADYIWTQYEMLLSGRRDELARLFRPQLRHDAVVYLNSPNASPFSLNSAVLNRLAVFLLLQHGGLRYRAGHMRVLGHLSMDHVRVAFNREGYPSEELVVQEVIVRHGPSSALERLLPKHVVDRFADVSAVNDFTRKRQYPPDFWSRSKSILADMRREVMMNYAAARFPQALSSLLQPSSGHSLTLELTDTGVSFVVTDRADASAERRSEFDEIQVEYRTLPPLRRVSEPATVAEWTDSSTQVAPESPLTVPAKRMPKTPQILIRSGIGVAAESVWKSPAFIPRLSGTGTLGCFVRLQTNAIALLTTATAIQPARTRDWIVLPAAGVRRIARVDRVEQAVPSPPGATLTDGTIIRNRFDAAVAVMVPGLTVTNEFLTPAVRPLQRDGSPRIGDTAVNASRHQATPVR